MRGKDPHNGKTCLLEEVLSTIPKTPSCNYNHFMTPFPLIKRSLHPQNGHYQNCVDRSLVENLTAPASVKMNSTVHVISGIFQNFTNMLGKAVI